MNHHNSYDLLLLLDNVIDDSRRYKKLIQKGDVLLMESEMKETNEVFDIQLSAPATTIAVGTEIQLTLRNLPFYWHGKRFAFVCDVEGVYEVIFEQVRSDGFVFLTIVFTQPGTFNWHGTFQLNTGEIIYSNTITIEVTAT